MKDSFPHKLIHGHTKNPLVQLLRYGVTGFIAFVVDYLLLMLLTDFFGLHYLISTAISFVCSVIVNYFLSINWVFNRSRKQKPMMVLSAFLIIGFFGLLITEVLMWTFTEKVHLHYLISKIIATFIVFFYNFITRRTFIEKRIEQQN